MPQIGAVHQAIILFVLTSVFLSQTFCAIEHGSTSDTTSAGNRIMHHKIVRDSERDSYSSNNTVVNDKVVTATGGVSGGYSGSMHQHGWRCHCWNVTDDVIDELECRCEGPKLTRIPQSLYKLHVQKLTLAETGLQVLRANGLKIYNTTLRDIVLTHLPKFHAVEAGAFTNLPLLRTIYIDMAPQLKTLPPGALDGITNSFRSLRIMRTGLTHTPDVTSLHADNILHMIDLEGNQIRRVESNAFHIKVEQLILDFNQIEFIGDNAFAGSELAKLSLKGNRKLRQISGNAFNGILNIRELDLSGTSLESLPHIGLDTLEVLRIQNTPTLKTIPSVYNFKNLQKAFLTHSFHCCAFKFPARHDPEKHAKEVAYRKSVNELCRKGASNIPVDDTGQKNSTGVNGTDPSEENYQKNKNEQLLLNREISSRLVKRSKRWFNDIEKYLESWSNDFDDSGKEQQATKSAEEESLQRIKRGLENLQEEMDGTLNDTEDDSSWGETVTFPGNDAIDEGDNTDFHIWGHFHDIVGLQDSSFNNPTDDHFSEHRTGARQRSYIDFLNPITGSPVKSGETWDGDEIDDMDHLITSDNFGYMTDEHNFADLGEFHQTEVQVPTSRVTANCGNLTQYVINVQCTPAPDALNPCEDVMGSHWLRGSVWIVVITAVFGNVAVLVVLLCSSGNEPTVPRFLMCHLALADLCMGGYLLLVASTDLHSMGEFFNCAYDWQYGAGCQIAGFLTVFASQLSIFTLTIVTLERWFAITYAIYLNKRIKLKAAAKIMVAGWLYSIFMATLPLVGVSNYSSTSICLPMETRDSWDVAYLTTLLTVNGLAFFVIVICYAQIYLSLGRDTRRGTGGAAASGEMNVAKKMALLVFTDFACWAPIAFFGLTAIAGYPLIDVTRSKILLVFFYPLNSCANPYLYAILTAQYRRDMFMLLSRYGLCTKKAQQYKMAYSMPTTNNSNPVPLISNRNNLEGKTGKANNNMDEAFV